MGVPKKRHTKSKRNKRRMHIYLEAPVLVTCPKCGGTKRPHMICPFCGDYRGREVINVMEKLTKKERKEREREIKDKEKEEVTRTRPLSLRELSVPLPKSR